MEDLYYFIGESGLVTVFCALTLWYFKRQMNQKDEQDKKSKEEFDSLRSRVYVLEGEKNALKQVTDVLSKIVDKIK